MAVFHLSLPAEILVHVFDRIGDVKCIAQCRLVCNYWNPLAEKAMFHQKLQIGCYDENDKLYKYLLANPDKSRLIRHLKMDLPYDEELDLDFVEKFLKLAFTPNLKILEGFATPAAYSIMNSIIENSTTKFNLKKIEFQGNTHGNNYMKLLSNLKHSAQSIHLKFKTAISLTNGTESFCSLNEFKALTGMRLENVNELTSIMHLNLVLEKCRYLQFLHLIVGQGSNYAEKEPDEMKDWLVQKVDKMESLKRLEIGFNLYRFMICSDILEYCVYKYPKMNTLYLNSMKIKFGHIKRTLAAIKNIKHLNINDWAIENIEDIKCIIQTLKSSKNSVEIMYNTWICQDRYKADVEKKRETKFTIAFATKNNPTPIIEKIVSSIGSIPTTIYLNIDLVGVRLHPSASIYGFLTKFPQTERLELTARSIKYENVQLETMNNLSYLELCAAEVDSKILTQLSNSAPHLHHLKLSSCLLFDKESYTTKTVQVDMPNTSLLSLSLTILPYESFDLYDTNESDEENHIKITEKQIKIASIAYLQLDSQLSATQYFVMRRSEPAIMISKQEFDLHSIGSVTFYVTCKSLLFLKIDLGGVQIKTNFDQGKLKDGSSSYSLQLEERIIELEQKYKAAMNITL